MYTNYKSGVYETYYGNTCTYEKGDSFAFDVDAREEIPLEMVEWDKFLREEN